VRTLTATGPRNRPAERERKMPVPPPGYPDDEPRTVLEPPPGAKGSIRTRTEPQLEPATVQGLVPIDQAQGRTENQPLLEEGGTMVDDDAHQRVTDEAKSDLRLSPGRNRSKNLAAQKQALLMWIAIGSGLVLGLVLAAFLIFG
jgi:hypothetical protein